MERDDEDRRHPERMSAEEDRRRRERIRANAALLGLPPLTLSEIRQQHRDARRAARLHPGWRGLPRRRLVAYLALVLVMLLPLLTAAVFLAEGERHLAAIALLAWVVMAIALHLASLGRLLREQRRSRNP
jgi:hypothetical protein